MRTFLIRVFSLIGLLFFIFSLPTSGLSAPVFPQPITVEQPDGTEITLIPFGNEWINGYETPEGFTVVQDKKTGFWHYAKRNAGGELVPSLYRVGIDKPLGLPRHVRPAPQAEQGPASQGEQGPAPAYIEPAAQAPWPGTSGTQAVLVILVEFSDQSSVGSTAAEWHDSFFGATGSVTDYYNEASYGDLTLVPAAETFTDTVGGEVNDGIIGWLDMGYDHPNTQGSITDDNRKLTYDALVAADSYIDYSTYDTNADGYITPDELHLVIVAAGYETSYGGTTYACTPNVWAHRWSLGWGNVDAPTLDGVTLAHWSVDGGYTQFGEWHQASNCGVSSSGHKATIGIMAHEMGHDLNWPDLYDTDGSSRGVGYWSIMGYGSWLGYVPGDTPSHPDAFSKWYQGWVTPLEGITQTVFLDQVESNREILKLLDNPDGVDWNFGYQSGTGEYFLIENRQKTGYDAYLPGCGLLIWHIDESVTSSNYANADEDHPLVDLEEADGNDDLYWANNAGDSGDPYPGSSGNNVFNDTSDPNSNLYSGDSSGVSVQINSTSCAATMELQVLSPFADQELTKTSPVTEVIAGEPLTYTLTVTNTGSYEATSVKVTDTLPAGVTYLSAVSTQGNCSETGGVVTCAVGTLSPSATATITLTVDVDSSTLGQIENIAQVSSTTPDPVLSNNTENEIITVNAQADLGIAKVDDPDPAFAGNPLTYTLTISNPGPSDALSVTVTDTLSTDVTFDQAVPSQGNCSHSGGVVTCTLGTVAASSSAEVTITVDIPSSSLVSSVQNTETPDPVSSNNSITETTTVSVQADMEITKTDDPDPVIAGNPLTYTLTITNNGPSDAQSVVVTDTLPSEVTYSGVSTTLGSCSQASGVATCTLGTMTPGASATVTIATDVPLGIYGALQNQAEVFSSTTDPDTGNNVVSEVTTAYIRVYLPLVIH
jgi:M6 family metalloprotease-like protein/uncharacterized repeat protein (TIGR01451 family)